jgi:hypothetical protein
MVESDFPVCRQIGSCCDGHSPSFPHDGCVSAQFLHYPILLTLITFTRYPTLYAICVLPLSVGRWIRFVQEHRYGRSTVPAAATFAVGTIFNLSGLFNVILLLTTRPESGLFGKLMRNPSGVPSGPSNLKSESEKTSAPATPATSATPRRDRESADGWLP